MLKTFDEKYSYVVDNFDDYMEDLDSFIKKETSLYDEYLVTLAVLVGK